MPSKCPVCGAKVVKEGAYHVCPAGLACRAQLIGHVIHYPSREAMDIGGLGERTVRRLVERGMVRDLADLYALSVENLLALEGFAKKSATALRDAIEDAKEPRLDRFLYALGIRHVGEHTAPILAQHFVVAGDGAGSKLDDAEKEGVRVIDEDAFERLLRG